MTAPIVFDIRTESGATVVSVGESIFAENRDQLMTALLRLADAPRARIVVDLSQVALCDSAALNMLVQVHQRATAAGGSLHLTNPQPMVRKTLRVTNLDRLIPVSTDIGGQE